MRRFFNPIPLQSRKAQKDIKTTTARIFINATQEKQPTSLKLPAHQFFFGVISTALKNLSEVPELQRDSTALDELSRKYSKVERDVRESNADAKLAELVGDLKAIGFELGRGRLEEYDISGGVETWVQNNAPQGWNR